MNGISRLILAATATLMFRPAAAAQEEGVWNPWEPGMKAPQGGDIRILEETGVLRISGFLAIRAYQVFVSPLSRPVCRFRPSCSRYALDALFAAGPLNGIIMGAERISRCHACASPALYPGSGTGILIDDPAQGNPVPLPMLAWFDL